MNTDEVVLENGVRYVRITGDFPRAILVQCGHYCRSAWTINDEPTACCKCFAIMHPEATRTGPCLICAVEG